MGIAKDNEVFNGITYGISPVTVNGMTEINDHLSLNGVKTVNGTNWEAEKTPATGSKQVNSQSLGGASERFETVTSPIAIIGMAMRLPGGVRDADSFWNLLANKKDGRCRVPKNRYNIDAFYSPYGKKGMVTVDDGYFLEDLDLYALDESFFSILQFEAESVDPQQRVLLEVVWECMENAGQTNWRGSTIGCFVGSFGEDWLDMAAKDTQKLDIYRISGSCDFMLSNRVSYEYDLKGPSMTIKSGCSASMLCLHEAFQSLQRGQCSSAIVGGTNLILTPTMTINMSEQGVISSTGSCKTFDASADGYARAEAINAIYIKKLDDAIRDGDPIRAIIRSTSSNCDGKTQGIYNPSPEAHEVMIRKAYEFAGIEDYSRTAFVECHGTGTAVGDPLEMQAIANVFGECGVYIGSVKPNVGHSEGASGITSIIKAVLSLENKTILPNINFSKPNPKIPFKSAHLTVPVEAIPWPTQRSERVSINSFGIGGANAHAILDSAASFGICARSDTEDLRSKLLVFSAHRADSLQKSIDDYQVYVKKYPRNLSDLAYTLGTRRDHLSYRAFCIAKGDGLLEVSSIKKAGATPRINFVFTGQGAQWPKMAKELMDEFPAFLQDIIKLGNVLNDVPYPPTWRIKDELSKDVNLTSVNKAEFAQPLCTAVQIALVNLLRSWGVSPAAVVGHSSGEIAGAYACGAITASEAIIIAYYRGFITKQKPKAGGMAAVGLSRKEANVFLVSGVVIACENSPRSVTLSGDQAALNYVCSRVKTELPETFVRHLQVETAYHSHHMVEFGNEYYNLIERRIAARQPKIPFYSSVTGKILDEPETLGPTYWRTNLESPVLFNSAVTAILLDQPENNLFLEIGPHSALSSPLRQIFQATNTQSIYESTLVRGKDCVESMLTTAGQLYSHAVSIDFSALNPSGTVLTNLPIYPWHHDRIFCGESRLSREWRFRKYARHDILGSRVTEGNDLEPAWRNVFGLDNLPWVRDHKILDDIVFPAAAYIAMAGEAVRQITSTNNFSLRHIVIGRALVLHESETTEIVTNMRPLRLTDTLDSAWFEFNISSYNGTTWTKNCSGQVRGGSYNNDRDMMEITPLPIEVSASKWYQTMRKIGLNYGTVFQRMSSITANPNGRMAAAKVIDQREPQESHYQIHPTAIDSCLQLFTVAMSRGMSRHLTKLSMPTEIEVLYIGGCSAEIQVHVDASLGGKAIGTADGEVVFQLRGLKWSSLKDQPRMEESPDPHAGAHLVWKENIDFADTKNLIHPVESRKDAIILCEKIAILCVLETLDRIASIKTQIPHLEKYRSWLEMQKRRAELGDNDILKDTQDLVKLSREDRMALIDNTVTEMQTRGDSGMSTPMVRILEYATRIFDGSSQAIEVLHEGDALTNLYNSTYSWNCKGLMDLLSHSKPNMKVLEVGAGTGATTAAALKDLTSMQGDRLYSEYTYTDISSGFFIAAKERFKDFPNIEYATLDISMDPISQGFEAESYDLILATNVLHATPQIGLTLANVRKLLQPDGRLFFHELYPSTQWLGYVMGILPGWWLGENDNRHQEPFISPERWAQELQNAGFSGADAVVYDNEIPYHLNVNILATPSRPIGVTKCVTVLCGSTNNPFAQQLEKFLATEGLAAKICVLGEEIPVGQDIISVLDLEKPFWDGVTASDFESFKQLTLNLQSAGMVWVTRPSQIGCDDPRCAMALGMARTIRSELGIDFATLEVDEVSSITWVTVLQVLRKFQSRNQDGDVDPDFEFVLSNGKVYIGRFHPMTVSKALSTASEGDKKRLDIGTFGLLETLHWTQCNSICLKGDEVEIETRAVGLNFRDVLIAMGIVDGSLIGLGGECSGIVRAVGPDVKDLAVGDRVTTLASWTFSTRVAASEKVCVKIPDDLSLENAATMSTVYSTVIHGLVDLGQLHRGSTVLIHSACGGVGIAAIQICQTFGATIFATVGNEEKSQYLEETYSIPRTHIFNSRDASFLPAVLKSTNGKGVDIVLNSLSGELLHVSWECVAEYGRMIEIGKRDFIGHGKLDMSLFAANRCFFGVDLGLISLNRPDVCKRLLERCMEYYRMGAIKPITPLKIFEATEIQDCFRYMQKGQHIGKIVVKMPENMENLPVTAMSEDLTLRSDVCYLLVGGLGGIGRAISTWMVEKGARNLVFLSRSAGNSADNAKFVSELVSLGCSVQVIPGSVSNIDDVRKVVNEARKPIAGVIQASMVLQNRSFMEMTLEDWEVAVSPKVKGTLNLHEILKSERLDFFILLSSLNGIFGSSGQANYAAGNTFLDAFVQFRRRHGLPASVIDVGVIDDIGYVSRNPSVLEHFRSISAYMIGERLLLDAVQLAIARSKSLPITEDSFINPSQIAIGLGSTLPLTSPNNHFPWRREARLGLYRNIENDTASGQGPSNEKLQQFLSAIVTEPSRLYEDSSASLLTLEIGLQIFHFLLRPKEDLDVKMSLSTIGVDSLLSIELRNWWRRTLNLEISVLEILNAGSIEELGKFALQGLREKYSHVGHAA